MIKAIDLLQKFMKIRDLMDASALEEIIELSRFGAGGGLIRGEG